MTRKSGPIRSLSGWILSLVLAVGLTTSVAVQEKGGEDLTGPYDVVPNWLKPLPGHDGWINMTNGVFAETPNRIYIVTGGEQGVPRAPAPSFGQPALFPDMLWESQARYRPEHFLYVVDGNGQLIEAWTQWDKLFGPAFGHTKVTMNPYDPDRHVWVSGRNQIFKFTHDGKQLAMTLGEIAPGNDERHFARPTDVAFFPDGTFLVSDGYDNTRVVKFDKNGKFLMQWGSKGTGPSQFNLVHCVTIDAKRRVYVSDRDNDRVQVFDENGKFLDMWPNIPRPSHLMISQDQFLWMSDGETNRVLKYDLNGKLLNYWGVYGTAPGALNNSHHFSVDPDGNLYVAEVRNQRVQKFTPKPTADRSRLVGQPFAARN